MTSSVLETDSPTSLLVQHRLHFGRGAVEQAYFLLVRAWWPGAKLAYDIPLIDKESHPRYSARAIYDLVREFPDWFLWLLCLKLT